MGLPFATIDECKAGLLTRILNNRANDEIVDVDSQRGGLISAVKQFDTALPYNRCIDAHVSITSDPRVSDWVKTLLNQSANSGGFERYSFAPPASVADGTLSREDATARAVSPATQRSTSSEAISFASPTDGQTVNPGSAIVVTVTATPVYTSAVVATPDQITPTLAQPFQTRIDIPATAIGPYTIGVLATTETGDTATAEITLSVTPNARVASLIVQPLEFVLRVGDTAKPRVSGVFADGVTRDLSRSTAVGFASSNASVVSVLPDGTLKAIGFGTARVTVSSDAASAEMLINVQSAARRRGVSH